MPRYLSLALSFVAGAAVAWVVTHRQHTPPPAVAVAPARRLPERITVARPDPAAPTGRAWHNLRVVPPVVPPAGRSLTDEWVITVLTDDIADGGGVTSVSYTAR